MPIQVVELFEPNECCLSLGNSEKKTTKTTFLMELNLFSHETIQIKKTKQKTKHLQHACVVVVVVAEDVLLTKTTGRISLYFFTHPFSQKYIKKKKWGAEWYPTGAVNRL